MAIICIVAINYHLSFQESGDNAIKEPAVQITTYVYLPFVIAIALYTVSITGYIKITKRNVPVIE